jgi:hypothetical protein
LTAPSWLRPDAGRLAAGACATALLAACAAGGALPEPLRMTVAVVALVLWPGAMLLRFFLADQEIEWPGRIAYSFGLGLLPAGLLALAAHFGRLDAGVGLWALPLLGFVLAVIAPPRPVAPADPRGLLPWAIMIGWILVVAAVVGGLGAPLTYQSDSLDHIATVRRIVATRESFPTDAFFHDAGASGADPRKGTYHVALALIARAAHADPVTLWRFLPLLFIPVFLLAMYVLTFTLTRSRMAGVVSVLIFPLIYGGGPGGSELRVAVYSTRVGEIVALLAAAALIRFVERGGKRRLALFWAVALSAVLVHVWIALWFALAFGAYALGSLLASPARERWKRFGLAFGGLLALAGPYLAFRARQSYGPQNVIHTEPQGLLLLGKGLFTVDPQAMWVWHGVWLLVALVAVPWFWSRRRDSTGSIYLAVVTPAVLLVMLNPFVLPLVQAKLGYLTMRFIWIAPVIPAAATVITALAEGAVRGRGARRVWAGLGLAGCALMLAPAVRQAVTLVTERAQLRADEAARSAAPWYDVLAFLGTRAPDLHVLASDPVTSYSIPAYAGRQVMAFYDQHSSPNDPRGLDRILDARAVLSPFVGVARTIELLRAYGVDAVVVNQRFDRPVATDYWSMNPVLAGRTLAKFQSRPGLFRPVFEAPGAWVFALTDSARHGALPADGAPPEPFTLPAAAAAGLGRATIDGAFAQHGTRIAGAAAAGDTLAVTTWWSLAADSAVAPGNYIVFLRLDARAMPRGPMYSSAYDKVYRKALERWTGRRWRFRTTHHPLNGVFAPDLWRPGEIVEDHYDMALPLNLAPGEYDVGVRMLRLPHYPNTRISDYLHDADEFSGPVVGRLTIAAPGAARVRR